MIYTLKEAKPFCAPHVEDGKAPDDPKVVEVINEAIQLLMQEGHWHHTLKKIAIATYNSVLPLPHNVETILGVDFDYSPSQVHSEWYEFLDGGPGLLVECNNVWREMLVDQGVFPTFFEIGPAQMKLAAFSTDSRDIDKKIRIRGINESHEQVAPTGPGEQIRIQGWKDGIEGDIDGSNITLSDNFFYRIESVVKEETQGYVTLLAMDLDTNRFHKLAKYQPYETNPGYRRYRITATQYSCQEWVTMIVKMRHVPLSHDSDVLPIQSLHAIRYMCKAIHDFNHGRLEDGFSQQTTALRFLDKSHSNAKPPHNELNVDVRVGSFGRRANLI